MAEDWAALGWLIAVGWRAPIAPGTPLDPAAPTGATRLGQSGRMIYARPA